MEPFAVGGRLLCLHILRRHHLLENASCDAMHPGQVYLLSTVIREPGLTQRELAGRMGVTAASVAQSVRRMEASGLLNRKSDEADRRRNRLYATAAGIAAAAGCRARADSIDARMLSGISDRELERLVRMLDRMLANLRTEGFDPSEFLSLKETCND